MPIGVMDGSLELSFLGLSDMVCIPSQSVFGRPVPRDCHFKMLVFHYYYYMGQNSGVCLCVSGGSCAGRCCLGSPMMETWYLGFVVMLLRWR